MNESSSDSMSSPTLGNVNCVNFGRLSCQSLNSLAVLHTLAGVEILAENS